MPKCYTNIEGICRFKNGDLCNASKFRRGKCIHKGEDHELINRIRQRYQLKCQDFKEEVRLYFENYQPKNVQP